jgi:hypothetical protein
MGKLWLKNASVQISKVTSWKNKRKFTKLSMKANKVPFWRSPKIRPLVWNIPVNPMG